MKHYTESELQEVEAALEGNDEEPYRLTVTKGDMRTFVSLVRSEQSRIQDIEDRGARTDMHIRVDLPKEAKREDAERLARDILNLAFQKMNGVCVSLQDADTKQPDH